MDFWLGMLAGGLCVLLGHWRAVAMRARREPKMLPPPEAICGCEHHFSFHDAEGCHHVRYIKLAGSAAYKIKSQVVPAPCGCVQYSGPEPLPEVTSWGAG